jgi:Myb/SANT-like DNA-binding domain
MANTNQNQNKTDLATRTTKLHFFPGPSFYGGRAILTEDDESPAVADWMDDDLPVPAHWDDEQRELLVFLLLNKESAKRRDARGNLTWPKEVWEEIVNDFAIVDIDYDVSQLKSGFRTIQKEYLEVKRMRKFPGFRWDKVSKQIFAMPETWNEYERVYNTRVNIIRWMDKRFLYLDRMHKLHGNAPIRDGWLLRNQRSDGMYTYLIELNNSWKTVRCTTSQ